MTNRIASALQCYRDAPHAKHPENPFNLESSFSRREDVERVRTAWPNMPAELLEFWQVCGSARLFVDVDYGQWGLVIFDPQASVSRTVSERDSRSGEYRIDDVVVGEFLGDLELLIMAPSEQEDRRILVARPLDGRSEWPGVARDLAEFLELYQKAGGDKYWEPCAGSATF